MRKVTMRKTTIKKTQSSYYAPDSRLAGLVKYWRIDSKGGIVSRLARVPGVYIEILFDCSSAGKKIPYLMGIQQKPVIFLKKRPAELIGIRFLPGSFFSLFRIPANRFLGKLVPLSSVTGLKAGVFNEIFAIKTLEAKVKRLDAILLDLAKTKEPVPPVIIRAFKNIRAGNGMIDICSLAENLGLTRFKFARLFAKWAGVNPRSFCKYLCFTAAARALNEGMSVGNVVAKFGYSDQPHFINVFKRRMGWSPTKRFKRGRRIFEA